MRFLNTIALLCITLLGSFLFAGQVHAQKNGYYPYVIALPQHRQMIRSMPIEHRPGRPLHFYGNIVRQSNTVRPTNTARPTITSRTTSSARTIYPQRSTFSSRPALAIRPTYTVRPTDRLVVTSRSTGSRSISSRR